MWQSVSVICVYNNEVQLNAQLIESLNKQDIDFELITIDNRENRFTSAASALNHGASMAKGEVFVFSHQDIYFKEKDTLRKLVESILLTNPGDIVGTQGTIEPNKSHYANLTSGTAYNSEIRYDYEPRLYEVSCVDEGLFGMKRETWLRHHFDEVLCDNWHLYCVECCLYARKNGNKVYVYPSQIHHFSRGTISLSYMTGLKRLCQVYRKDNRYIWTTCYKVRTHPIYIDGLLFLWKTNRRLRGRLK